MTIRRAGPGDLSSLLVLIREFYEVDRHHYDERVLSAALLPLLADDTVGQVWLFDTGYAVLAWGYSLESGGRDALIDEFYVRNRGGGIGAKVLPELIDACQGAGARKVFLETEDRNEAARRFYRRNGFDLEHSTWLSQLL
ncbi:MAG: GNAT family N-acetyltransferase [Mycobacteriaceae bacterium]|nr:GNAT family N-acetyltransferase [Mycobacteriaceae bacterium]